LINYYNVYFDAFIFDVKDSSSLHINNNLVYDYGNNIPNSDFIELTNIDSNIEFYSLHKENCGDKEVKIDKCHIKKELTHEACLYVIAVVSNPARFSRRYQLFNEFCERLSKEENLILFSVELQQGSRPFQTNANLKLRTNDELWFKENLINIAASHLPEDWEYMAWIDTDLEFQNKNWVRETIEQLQTYKIVQLFSHAIDLGCKGETLQVHIGFCYQHVNGETWKAPKYGGTWHPGYAWAIRRETYDKLGGLMDFPILGSADHHMSLAFIGLVDRYIKNIYDNKRQHSSGLPLVELWYQWSTIKGSPQPIFDPSVIFHAHEHSTQMVKTIKEIKYTAQPNEYYIAEVAFARQNKKWDRDVYQISIDYSKKITHKAVLAMDDQIHMKKLDNLLAYNPKGTSVSYSIV
jgi:hypothetical protein